MAAFQIQLFGVMVAAGSLIQPWPMLNGQDARILTSVAALQWQHRFCLHHLMHQLNPLRKVFQHLLSANKSKLRMMPSWHSLSFNGNQVSWFRWLR